MTTQLIHVLGPLMMSVETFAKLHDVSTTTVWDCIHGRSTSYPPLKAKRTRSKRGDTYITAEAAAEWRAAMQDK